jgi:hypothetical protein
MSGLSPREIQHHLEEGLMSEREAIELLIAHVENHPDHIVRVNAMNILAGFHFTSEQQFSFFEQVLISDIDTQIRVEAAHIIVRNFLDHGKGTLRWLFEHEVPPILIEVTISALLPIDEPFLREVVVERIIDFRDRGLLFERKELQRVYDDAFLKSYEKMFKTISVDTLSTAHLADMYLNVAAISWIGYIYGHSYEFCAESMDGLVTEFWYNWLRLDGVEALKDVEGLSCLKHLRELNMEYCDLKSLEGIENFKELEYANLKGNKISEIKNLEGLKELKGIDLAENKIVEIKGLVGLKKLAHLNLYGNKICKIDGLDTLENTMDLCLSNNQITRIEGLKHLKKLNYLELAENKILKISGLKTLGNLIDLDLGYNKIAKIEGLKRLKKLEVLNLWTNQITVLEGIKHLKSLRILFLIDNPVKVVRDLEYLPGGVHIDIDIAEDVQFRGLEQCSKDIDLSITAEKLSEKTRQYLNDLVKKKKNLRIEFPSRAELPRK